MLRRMGPLQGVLKLIPGIGSQLKDVDIDENELKKVEAIVLSMTPHERNTPHVIDGKRRIRIAKGSGTSVQEVNQLLKQYAEARKMMKMVSGGLTGGLGKRMGKMKLPPGFPFGNLPGPPGRESR